MTSPPPADRSTPRSLVLVGLMGSGKTTVGRLLAAEMGCELVDTDELVEQATGTTIRDLFARHGEPAFRRYELESLGRALARPHPVVVATGGGVVSTPEGRALLAVHTTVVWLRAAPATLAGRITGDSSRPLLSGRDPLAVLTELHERRSPLYEEVADVVIDVDTARPDEVARQVLDVLGLAA